MPGTTTTFTWSNPSGGDWTVPADWGATSFPNSTTAIAVIALAGSYTVSLAGTDSAITVGGLSITDTSAELSITNAGSANVVDGNLLNAGMLRVAQGGSLTVSGNLTSTGALLLDGDTYTGEGGSLLTVTGTLTNSGGISIGPPSGNLTANDTLSVGALAGAANVGLFGSASQANLVIAAAAPAILDYNLSLYSYALVQYGSGSIGTIASGITLLLDGADAHVSDAGATTTDSALAGLTENDGTLPIVNGASVAIAGNFDSAGALLLDGDAYTGEGGSSLTIAGTLRNSGGISIGPPSGNLSASDTLSVGALAGIANVGLFGSASQANFLIAAAAPTTLNSDLSLYGDALVQFGTGEIGTIASSVALLLDGLGGHVSDTGKTTTNSALTGLTENDGTLRIVNGASVGLTGNLNNVGPLLLDGDAYTGEGGSSLTIGGTLTNSGGISIGPPSGNLSANDTLSVRALAGIGNVGLFGSASQANFVIAAAAPTTLNYNLSLSSDALVQFGTGEIGTIASNITLLLDGPGALVADGGKTTTDSALTGLTENDGTLRIINGASVAVAGNLANTGNLLLDGDGYAREGGSSLTIAGTLANSGAISIGPPSGALSANTTLSVAALTGTGSVGLFGGTPQATFDIAAAAAGNVEFQSVRVRRLADAVWHRGDRHHCRHRHAIAVRADRANCRCRAHRQRQCAERAERVRRHADSAERRQPGRWRQPDRHQPDRPRRRYLFGRGRVEPLGCRHADQYRADLGRPGRRQSDGEHHADRRNADQQPFGQC
jgi:hypothetical protein